MHLGDITILSTTLFKMWVLIQDLCVSMCVCVCVCVCNIMYIMYNVYNMCI